MRGSKYDPLCVFLRTASQQDITLSLEEIEDILGFALSPSAETPGWWVNASSMKTRAQTHAWIDAGYEASLKQGFVTFRKAQRIRAQTDGS